MLGKNLIHKSVTLVTVAAVWCVYSMAAFALPKDISGEISVTGQVTVNGQPAVSGSTVLSGAVVTTAKGSSAVVSLGKLGRVEILEDSSTTLRFSETGIVAMVDQGRIRVSSSSGIATTVTTKTATIIGDAGQANNFLVESECSHTHVDTASGVVTMREGTSDKQVVAGTTATAGNLTQTGCKPCLRPDSAPNTAVTGNTWLILVALGAAAAAIYLGTKSGDTNFDTTTTTTVSPIR